MIVAVQVHTLRTRTDQHRTRTNNYRYDDRQRFSEDWYVFGDGQVIYMGIADC